MKYQHRFEVNAPLDEVADFHSQSKSMAAITPPPVTVQVRQAPAHLGEGDEMDFTLWLGPLPIHWLACIENVSSTGFTDRQLRGPFGHWVHRHTFEPINDATTAVVETTAAVATTAIVDEIQLSLRKHPFWGLIGLGMWLSLPILFAYRGWRTRRLLDSRVETKSKTYSERKHVR